MIGMVVRGNMLIVLGESEDNTFDFENADA